MKRGDWINSRFVKSAAHIGECPLLKDDSGNYLPEIAVLGRSNVGKSSLLNHLFKAKQLVRVSSKPGKTQLLNFFTVNGILTLVDLPGYGFAEVPIEVRKAFGPMIQTYLDQRIQLKLFLFLFDIRRIPQKEDLELMEWIKQSQKEVIVVLTKVDKLTKNELLKQRETIIKAFGCQEPSYINYSVTKNIGREELLREIEKAFKEEV